MSRRDLGSLGSCSLRPPPSAFRLAHWNGSAIGVRILPHIWRDKGPLLPDQSALRASHLNFLTGFRISRCYSALHGRRDSGRIVNCEELTPRVSTKARTRKTLNAEMLLGGLQSIPQHFLYFLPLPHGQGSLRPGLCAVRTGC